MSGLAELVRSNAAAILRSTWFDERDHRRIPIEATVIPSTFIHMSGMLQSVIFICEGLSVNASRMEANIKLLKGLNFSEIVMTALAERGLGRHTAHELLQEITHTVINDNIEFGSVLKNHETIRGYLSEER